MRDFHTDAVYAPLSDEHLAEIEAEASAQTDAAEAAARQDRLTGLRCVCCDEPLPPGPPGRECNDCQNISI